MALANKPALLLLLLLAFVPACAHQTAKPTPVAAPVSAAPDDIDLASDPCALRMQDLAGAMLIYYTAHKSLPPTLDGLFAANNPLETTCPVSGLPYVYVPTGLVAPGQSRLLVLYDPTPAHHGYRWGIILSLDHSPITTDVVRLDEKVLNIYLKSAPSQ